MSIEEDYVQTAYLWSHCAGLRRFRCIYDAHDGRDSTRRYRSDKGKKESKVN